MRSLYAIAAFSVLASSAAAERLVFLPMGDRYSSNSLRFETLVEGMSLGNRQTFLGVGLGQAFDVDFTLFNPRFRNVELGSFDFSYNFVPALPDFGFGISVGIQDAMNRLPAGRSFFVAVTGRFNNFDAQNSRTPTELTLGAGTGRYRGLFLSTRLPITDMFRLLAEYDSKDLTAGLEVALKEDIKLRWLVNNRETLVGASFGLRF